MKTYEVDFEAIDEVLDAGESVETERDPMDFEFYPRRPSYEFIHTESQDWQEANYPDTLEDFEVDEAMLVLLVDEGEKIGYTPEQIGADMVVAEAPPLQACWYSLEFVRQHREERNTAKVRLNKLPSYRWYVKMENMSLEEEYDNWSN